MTEPQHMVALAKANEVRLAAAALKREIKNGELPIAAALEDERAQPLQIGDLLAAQHKWGSVRTRWLLEPLYIAEHRRVRDLTERQRQLLITELGREARSA